MDFWTFKIKNREDIKFGSIDSNGFIVVPDSISGKSIKFYLCHKFNLNEKNAVLLIFLPTLFFALIGLFLT